jgi:chorismate-pyruvate lyase
MWYNSLQEINLIDSCWSWLANTGSLTKYLNQQAGREDLVIKLLTQHWRAPVSDECLRLQLQNSNEILERKIVMTVMNRPWLFARTYFSKRASELMGRDLGNLAANSLGALIEKSYPHIIRGQLQFAFLHNNEQMFQSILKLLTNNNYLINPDNNILRNKFIMRRSLYYYNDMILFNIDEVFLPALINKMLQLEVVE